MALTWPPRSATASMWPQRPRPTRLSSGRARRDERRDSASSGGHRLAVGLGRDFAAVLVVEHRGLVEGIATFGRDFAAVLVVDHRGLVEGIATSQHLLHP